LKRSLGLIVNRKGVLFYNKTNNKHFFFFD
jgi:hypothetical protein